MEGSPPTLTLARPSKEPMSKPFSVAVPPPLNAAELVTKVSILATVSCAPEPLTDRMGTLPPPLPSTPKWKLLLSVAVTVTCPPATIDKAGNPALACPKLRSLVVRVEGLPPLAVPPTRIEPVPLLPTSMLESTVTLPPLRIFNCPSPPEVVPRSSWETCRAEFPPSTVICPAPLRFSPTRIFSSVLLSVAPFSRVNLPVPPPPTVSAVRTLSFESFAPPLPVTVSVPLLPDSSPSTSEPTVRLA